MKNRKSINSGHSYIATHRSEEAKRKQSEQRRLQRKRSQKFLDENAVYGPPS